MRNSEFASAPPIARVILYVKDIPKVAAFYERFFGMIRMEGSSDGWQELTSPAGGCTIALHQAAVSQKSGAAMKLVFGVADVEGFRVTAEKKGLRFGVVHRAEENGKRFEFSNAKDPAGNSISISSRGWAGRNKAASPTNCPKLRAASAPDANFPKT
jgi:predicted enzyme related to lactoylglutathione lyase